MLSIILMTLLVCGLSTNAWAQYYKYVDKNGTVCFTENPTASEVRGFMEKKGIDGIKDRTTGNRQLTREGMLIYSTEKPGSAEAAQKQRKIREAQEEALYQRGKTQKKQVDIERKLRQMENAQRGAISDAESKMKSMQQETERKLQSEMTFQKMQIENQIRMNNGW